MGNSASVKNISMSSVPTPFISPKKLVGFYSKITETDKYIIKTISCNKKNMMSWPEAENLKEHILFYKRELNRLKVPNPELMSCKIKEVSRNKYLLVMREEKIKGRSISEMSQDKTISDKQYLGYLRKILTYYISVDTRGRKISLDPPLSNFILGYNNKDQKNIYYVDSMPPRQQTFDYWVVEYPGPKKLELQNYHYKRHFTDSQFQVIFVQMCKERISLRKILIEMFVKTFSKKALKHIKTPGTAPAIFNLLNSCQIKDIDYIRNIALELLFLNIISRDDFENIYKQTHVQEGSGNLPKSEELVNLNIFLLNRLKDK